MDELVKENPAPGAKVSQPPVIPRRALVAGVLSAITAGAMAGLAAWGAADLSRTDAFQFTRGTSWARGEEVRLKGFLSQAVTDARIRVVIVGHTGQQGDLVANTNLSETRARVAADIALGMGVAPDNIVVNGVAGTAPLAKAEGQSERAFQSSLSRVEVTLQVMK